MKLYCFINLVTAIVCLVAFSTADCVGKDKATNTSTPSENVMSATTMQEESATTSTMPASASSDAALVKWIDIKDNTYDTRASFFTGLKQLEARVTGQIKELTAKRSAMKGDANTKDWDFAMKEMLDARSYLKSVGEELSKANADTWNQQKETVGQAWGRTQDAYNKVKSSTTI